jgi:hypothetical protein
MRVQRLRYPLLCEGRKGEGEKRRIKQKTMLSMVVVSYFQV